MYKSQVEGLISVVGIYYLSSFVAKITARGEEVSGVLGAVETGGVSLIAVLTGIIQEAVVSLVADKAFNYAQNKILDNLMKNIKTLNCYNCPGNSNCPNPGGDENERNSGSGDVGHLMDPSGYVYEAVSSNRLEGVKATVYFKEKEFDIYGDTIDVVTKWDAASYLQVNPQFTDENGMYAWDVPNGLWQVKYEKAGYTTKYSDWLPVPPPQLDINIGMVQSNAPKINKIRGYEEGINIQFDKYMLSDTLKTNKILVNKNNSNITGTINLLNEEEGYANDTAKYVSKVRFIPTQNFTLGDTLFVTIKSTAESYAGIKMGNDTILKVIIEKEIKTITSDTLVEMKLHGSRNVTVTVTPAIAAQGKTITATVSSSLISLDTTQAILDTNGKAIFKVNGNLPGVASVNFTIIDVDDLFGSTNVNVSLNSKVSNPVSTILSNTFVPKDTTVELYCTTNGSHIYYSIDGTIPNDTSGNYPIYSLPIPISRSSIINAMAVKDGFDNSDIVKFTYYVSQIFDNPQTICSGNTYTINGHVYSIAGTYIDTLQTSLGLDSIISTNLTVNPLPASAGTISGLATVCQGQSSVTYKVPSIANATSYTWTLPSGASGTSSVDSIVVNYGTSATSGNITVKGYNICGNGDSSTMAVTVNPLPASAGTISGLATVCQGQSSVVYQVPSIANATSYTWTLPSGATVTSSVDSIVVNYGTSATSGILKVKGINACGYGDSSTLAITVNLLPQTPVITQNGDTLLSDIIIGNQWYSLTNGIINNATSAFYLPQQIGDYFTIVTLNGCSSDTSNILHFDNTGINYLFGSDCKIIVSPNPFSVNTTISYTLTENKYIRLSISDITGRVVEVLHEGYQAKGEYKYVFTPKSIANGIYFYKLQIENKYVSGKMIYAK